MSVRHRKGTGRTLGCATLVALAVFAAGCGAARRGEPIGSPVLLDERAERGRVVFMAKCQQCHPGGEAGLGPALNDKPLPEFLKRFQVRHGLGAMPSFSEQEISDAQLESLMDYLEALRRAKPMRRATTDGNSRR